jgi:transcription elongation factor Elf1
MTDITDAYHGSEPDEYVDADALTRDKRPFLARLGARDNDSAGSVNLDVSGTVGPDYIGQETVDVDGHPQDRPGVQNRRFDRYRNDDDPPLPATIRRQATGEEMPVLLSSSMSSDPIEGTQGSYTILVEGDCPRCGYDRIKRSVATLAGVTQMQCNACGAQWERNRRDWSMPTTPSERVDNYRDGDATEKLGDAGKFEVWQTAGDMDDAVKLIHGTTMLRARADDILSLVGLLDERDIIGLDDIEAEFRSRSLVPDEKPHRLLCAMSLLPDEFEVNVRQGYVSDEQVGEMWDHFDSIGA